MDLPPRLDHWARGFSEDFDAFVASPRFGEFDDHRLQLSPLPIPYVGNLARADIVILLLNPGYGFTDYYAESRMPAFRRRLEMNLRQSFEGTEFPFLCLDPQFCWHEGFGWWERKLRNVLALIADEKFNGSYLAALRDLSTRFACVELVPYHSSSFRSHGLIDKLPSVTAAKKFAETTLFPEVERGDRTVIVTRQAKA